jgi:hypothetical protein
MHILLIVINNHILTFRQFGESRLFLCVFSFVLFFVCFFFVFCLQGGNGVS